MYYVEVNWFNTAEESDVIDYAIICAENWSAAMQSISENYDYINSINMKEINSDFQNVVYINKDMYETIADLNSY